MSLLVNYIPNLLAVDNIFKVIFVCSEVVVNTIKTHLNFAKTSVHSILTRVEDFEMITNRTKTTIEKGKGVLCVASVAINSTKHLIETATDGLELADDGVNAIVDRLKRVFDSIKVTTDCTKHVIRFVKTFVDGGFHNCQPFVDGRFHTCQAIVDA